MRKVPPPAFRRADCITAMLDRVQEPSTSCHGGGALDYRYGSQTVYNRESPFV